MKKRLLAIVLTGAMVICLCACGKDSGNATASGNMITDANGFTHAVVDGVDPSYYDNPEIASVSEDGNIIKYKNGGIEVLDTDLLTGKQKEANDAMEDALSSFSANMQQAAEELQTATDNIKTEHMGLFMGSVYFGEDIHNAIGLRFDALLENYRTDYDENTLLMSGEISEEFEVERISSGDVFTVKIMNPYEKPNPASLCVVCYEKFEAGSCDVALRIDNELKLGSASHDEIFNYFVEPYEDTENQIHYKTHAVSLNGFSNVQYGSGTGETAYETSGNLDCILEFSNDKLDSISLEDRDLLFHGIQDNLSEDDLYALEPSVYEVVEATTGSIADEIEESAEESGFDISGIDANSGKVVMDSTFLFGYDKSDLTDEAAKYLDEFLAVYASVLLDEANYKNIKEIAIEGHTDSDGSFEYNQTLSEKRAQAVLDYCINSNALSADDKIKLKEKVTSKGYSYTDLVYDENGNEDSEASRRVCFKFIVNVD